MGITDLPGGFVLTGGQAAMPGVMSLAQDVLQTMSEWQARIISV